MATKKQYIDRDLSWLSFNRRVLEEANNQDIPLYERLKFLAIYSSNLDEFYKVRVASHRSLAEMNTKQKEELKNSPDALLKKINTIVQEQQQAFGNIFYNEILPELKKNDINLVQDFNELNNVHSEFIEKYFLDNVLPYLQPILLVKQQILPFLQDNAIYFAIILQNKALNSGNKSNKYAILKIPTDQIPRFLNLPRESEMHHIVFIDDVIKKHLNYIFPGYTIIDSFSIKLSRSAELPIEDEFSGDLVEKIKSSLAKRKTGTPCRLLYDENIPKNLLNLLKKIFNLSKNDLIPGGKYHNFSDFFGFPNPKAPFLFNQPQPPLKLKSIEEKDSIFELIEEKDIAIHPPYQSYEYVLRFFNEAAVDPEVEEIKLTQYRVAKKSAIVNALINAARNGKKVTVFVEVKARFDEASNLHCAEEMKKAGVKIIYSMPGLKVHAKIALVLKKNSSLAFVSTGNFNEKTSQIYADHCLFTSNNELITDINNVFKFFKTQNKKLSFDQLLVGQFNMRQEFLRMIDVEIENAKKGLHASMTLKMNGLEDKKMIKKLYEASQKGVKINLLIRGICCLVPNKSFSENITITRIVDRYLEHARVYHFYNNGKNNLYIASADWMNRNLKRRIETAIPILDNTIKTDLIKVLEIQLSDNTSARRVDSEGRNQIIEPKGQKVRAQESIYEYFKTKDY